MSMSRRLRHALAVILPVGAVATAVGLYLFEPWALWTDTTVDEPIPVVAPTGAAPDPASDGPAGPSEEPDPVTPSPAEPVVLATGRLISHEHETDGRVVVLELADGSRILRLEDLDTSNGPDVEVWVTDAPVIEGADGWHVFDDGEYVDLGDLKGNHGNQNYDLPDSVDLAELTSVSLWCDRFNVSFGAAELT
jgi:hypothetical protein